LTKEKINYKLYIKDDNMKVVQTSAAPAAIGPYSQAFVSGNLVFTSGQIPLSPGTGEVTGAGISEQTEQVVKNLKAVLEAAGSSLSNVVKTTCFLADMNDFAAFNEVYAKHFTGKPARSTVAVRQLPKSVLVEIEAVAEI
jgi:2-iminobutanoate/2-iminopropanoate deaminase